MNHLGKPDAGNLPVRFDEGDGDGVRRAISTLLVWFFCVFQAYCFSVRPWLLSVPQ